MINVSKLNSLYPIFVFGAIYTFIFLLFKQTFFYSLPFLVGFLIAYMVRKPIAFFRRRFNIKNNLASALVTGGFILLLFVILFFLLYWAIQETASFLTWLSNDNFKKPTQLFFLTVEKINQFFGKEILENNIQSVMDSLLAGAGLLTTALTVLLETLSSIPTILTWIIVAVFSSFVFSKNMNSIKDFIYSFFNEEGLFHIRHAIQSTGNSGKKSLISYIFLYLIAFCESLIITFILGIDYPVIISIVMSIADILPILGPGLVYLPLACFYLLTGHYGIAVGLIIGYLVITITREIIEPKLVADSTKIHPLSMVAAIYFSLVAKNFWIMIYVLGLSMFYSLLKESGALPSLQNRKGE